MAFTVSAPLFSTIRNIQIFTMGLVFGSILLFASSYALPGGIGTSQFSRIITNVNLVIFLHTKNDLSLSSQRKLQLIALILSCVWVIIFFFFAGWLTYLARTQGTVVAYLVVGLDLPIGTLMLMDAFLTELYCSHLNHQRARSYKNSSLDFGSENYDTGTLVDRPIRSGNME
ncbi:hypothetical protein EC968_000578 [Mortierella alpina]|nr:hypothetical protein EC968_000578 [Mortierella alpina]